MTAHIRDLEKLLEQKGVQVSQGQPPSAFGTETQHDSQNVGTRKDEWTQFRSLWIKECSVQSGEDSSDDPSRRSPEQPPFVPLPATGARPIGGHLGVSKDSLPLSSINGTLLSILGTTIDITSFDAPDMDGPPVGMSNSAPIYNKSLQSFYNSVAKVNPPVQAALPSREEAFSYSEWYFCIVGCFLPVLHKPTYFALVNIFVMSFPVLRSVPLSDATFLFASFHEFTTIATSNPRHQNRSLFTWFSPSCTINSAFETVMTLNERSS